MMLKCNFRLDMWSTLSALNPLLEDISHPVLLRGCGGGGLGAKFCRASDKLFQGLHNMGFPNLFWLPGQVSSWLKDRDLILCWTLLFSFPRLSSISLYQLPVVSLHSQPVCRSNREQLVLVSWRWESQECEEATYWITLNLSLLTPSHSSSLQDFRLLCLTTPNRPSRSLLLCSCNLKNGLF